MFYIIQTRLKKKSCSYRIAHFIHEECYIYTYNVYLDIYKYIFGICEQNKCTKSNDVCDVQWK